MTHVTGNPKGNAAGAPVVLHHVQVGLQGGQEELQDLWVGQQLRGSSSNRSQPFQEVLIRQAASLWGSEPRLRLHDQKVSIQPAKQLPSFITRLHTFMHG